MRIPLLHTLITTIVTFSIVSETFGQLTIQQPVIQSTGGQFAVSVPDRGGVLLGSVSRAGESRSSYGFPFTRGSSVGRFAEHSSMTSHVWIHDLREMDRLILEMAETDPNGQRTSTSSEARRAGLAWTDFQPRRGVAVEDRRPHSLQTSERYRSSQFLDPKTRQITTDSVQINRSFEARASQSLALTSRRSHALDPAHSYRLGVEAEESGKLTVAKLHYQTAAQYGSEQAARRLLELASSPIAGK